MSSFIIRGSYGDLTIDSTTGVVTARTGYPEITRFDLDEYRAWYQARGEESLLDKIDEEDILDLGYWTTDGEEPYVEADFAHREGLAP